MNRPGFLRDSPAQLHAFRTYLAGLLAPRERAKTLTALGGANHHSGPSHTGPAVAVLPEAAWGYRSIATSTLEPLCSDRLVALTPDGALVIDDTGGHKDGYATDHVAHQYLDLVSKIDSGIVAVTTFWENEQHNYPLHVMPYTSESRLVGSK